MKTNKILLGGITGGIAYFFLGWLIYGILLMDYMQEFTNTTISRPDEEMIWWAMILSNLAMGFLLSIVFAWSNTKTLFNGAKVAAIIGGLFAVSVDFSFYSMTTIYSVLTPIIVDIIAYVVMSAITGAAIAWVTSLVKQKV